MRKLLLISYYYPPGNFAGSYRTKAWAEHLRKFGYYPIVVTRHWNENENDYTAISDQKEITKEENEKFTVYRLPYKGSLRDKLIKRFGNKAQFFGKILSFFQVIGQNYFLWSVPYRNLYDFSRQLLKDNPDINIVITSGRPFVQFRFCYLLKKEFSQIQWIADYRDAWNSDVTIKHSLSRRLQKKFEFTREIKWLSSASLITTVSCGLCDELKMHLSKDTHVIYNGFEPNDFIDINDYLGANEDFVIVYNGTLYKGQQIELFLEIYREVHNALSEKYKIKLVFAGTKPNNRIESFINNNPDLNIEITYRMPRQDVLKLQKRSQVLLMVGHTEQKGIVSSKIFEYFGLQKPIILCPSDNDVLEALICKTQTGFIYNNKPEGVMHFTHLIESYFNNTIGHFAPDKNEVNTYTRENQTRILANHLHLLV